MVIRNFRFSAVRELVFIAAAVKKREMYSK